VIAQPNVITHHEGIAETRMADIVTHGGDQDRENILRAENLSRAT